VSLPLRIGILGCARIAPLALVGPARRHPDALVASVASRAPERARRFAGRHGIPRAHADYASLLDDPAIEAVYVPLPNALHASWTIRALEAGKHVLCEKPLASNADEAERMAEAAQRSGRVLMEAFHYRYHPLADRVLDVLASGELGRLRHVEAGLCIPLPWPRDIRFDFALGGGALMDTGCYAVSWVRTLAGAEPEVLNARAWLLSAQVDRAFEAALRFPGDVSGRVVCSLLSKRLLGAWLSVRCDQGRLRVLNPVMPQLFHRLVVDGPGGRRVERVPGPGSYDGQLAAFVRAARGGAPPPTDGREGVRNMRVVDALYRAARLRPRGT